MGSENGNAEQVILATGGYDHTIHFWQAHSGLCQRSVQHPGSQVNALEITPNAQLLAAAGYQHIRMYDINSNNPNPVINYEGITKNVTGVGFQEDGRWMYTGGEDGVARIWDLRSRSLQCQKTFPSSFPSIQPVNCICIHPNQGELYIGDQGGTIYMWDLRAESNEANVKQPFFKSTDPDVSIQSIHIDVEGSLMAAVDNKGNCYLFSLSNARNEDNTSQPLKHWKLAAHKRYALKCKFSPDSTLLVTTSADSIAKIWRTSDLQMLMDQKEPAKPTISWGLGSQFCNSSGTKTAETTPMIELKTSEQRWVWDVAFSADSQYVITASSDNHARLWSVATGEVKREYTGHQKALTALAFRDGS